MRDELTLPRTIRGREAGIDLAQLRRDARLVARVCAAMPGARVSIGHDDDGAPGAVRVTLRDGSTRTIRPAEVSAPPTTPATAAPREVIVRREVVYRRPPTLDEMRVRQRAVEMEIGFERARARLALDEQMRQAARQRRT